MTAEAAGGTCIVRADASRNQRTVEFRMTLNQRPFEHAPAAAIGIVEYSPIPAAADERLSANAQRSPDLAGRRQLAPECADIFDVFMSMQLHCVEVHQRREIADGAERRIAEDPDGQHA